MTVWNGQVQKNVGTYDTRYEIEFEIPYEVAADAVYVFDYSSHKCSDIMAYRLYRAVREAWMERGDTAEVKVSYRDDGWKAWVLKTAGMRPSFLSDEAEQNLDKFEDFIEKDL